MVESALVPSPDLETERAFLAEAHAALARMHADVLVREVQVIGSEDNDERFTNEANASAHQQRVLALVDLPDVPLFFGLLDYERGTIEGTDRIHIGRRHVHDGNGVPLVIDWRARVSVPFYRATASDRQHVVLRRRYGFSDAAELTGFEDEPLVGAVASDQADAFLRSEIERPRTGPMRDIVATIQPEQDDLVRAPLHPSVCVQGAPGTGKTWWCGDRRAEPLVPFLHPQGSPGPRRGRRTADHHRRADQRARRGGGRTRGRAAQG